VPNAGRGVRRLHAVVRSSCVRHRAFIVVCVMGAAVRALLIPLGHGQDFVVWQLASDATLRGVNVYAHHPAYPGGPYAYSPLFLYIELPMRWLSEHSPVPFVVLGKLPIMASDFGISALLYRLLLRRGGRPSRSALGAALFLLNPLVLYNGAFYGRFDTLACALLLLFTCAQGRSFPWRNLWYALAVAAKTFPLFVVAVVLRAAGRRWRVAVAVVVLVVLAISLPYLADPAPYVHDVVLYDAGKQPTGMSWWTLLNGVCSHLVASSVSGIGLLAFGVGAVMIGRRLHSDLTAAIAATLVLFLMCNKVVLEQYLIWPMPWLVALAMRDRSRLATASSTLLGIFTVAGLIDNEFFHPFGHDSPVLGTLLAIGDAAYVVIAWRSGRAETVITSVAVRGLERESVPA
jgi:hypothetical protein